MRYIILIAFLVGCGESEDTTQWSFTLGAWEAPMCRGTLTLSPDKERPSAFEGVNMIGTWGCGVYGTEAHADLRTDGRAFLELETYPGFLNAVRGTIEADDAIVGDMLLNDAQVRFAAYRQ